MPSFLWYVPSLTSGMFLNLILFSWVLDAVGVNVLESCGKLFRAFKLQPSSGGFVETLSAQVDKIVWVFLRTSLAKFWRLYYLEGVQNSFSPNAWTLFALVRTRLSCYPLKTFTLFLSGRHEKPHLFFYFHLSSHPPPLFLIAQPSGHAPPNQPIRKQCALQAHTSLDWLISIDVLVAYTHRLQVTQIYTRARVVCVFTLRSKHTKKYRLRECLKSSAFNPSTLVSPPFCLTCVL